MRPSERLTFAAMLVLVATIFAVRPEGAALRLLVFASMAAATMLLSRRPGGGPVGFVRDWLPVSVLITTFLLLQPIVEAAAPWRLDATLAALDARWFPGLVAAWRAAFGRPAVFTDLVYLAYFSYYFLPITVAAVAWRRGPAEFERTVFALLLCFYLTYLGYLLMPAAGPRLAPADEARELGGGALSDAVRAFLHAAETTTLDAFPSGHTAVSVVAGACGARLLGRWASSAVWAWALAIVFATVYIDVHYVVDVVAGLALALLVLFVLSARARSAS